MGSDKEAISPVSVILSMPQHKEENNQRVSSKISKLRCCFLTEPHRAEDLPRTLCSADFLKEVRVKGSARGMVIFIRLLLQDQAQCLQHGKRGPLIHTNKPLCKMVSYFLLLSLQQQLRNF